MRCLAILFAFTTTLPAAPKADFFVSPSGKDTWSGTHAGGNAAGTDGPFRTLTRARDAVRAPAPNRNSIAQSWSQLRAVAMSKRRRCH